MGPPDEPISVGDLVPAAVRGAWDNLEDRADAMRLKRDIQARTSELVAANLADLLVEIQDKAQVAVAAVIHRVRAMTDVAKMGEQIAETVPVPGIPEISEAERQRLERLNKTVQKAIAAANAQAARRPTFREGLEKVEDEVAGFSEILETYWPGLLAVPGVGGVVYAARKRKQAREAQREATRLIAENVIAKPPDGS